MNSASFWGVGEASLIPLDGGPSNVGGLEWSFDGVSFDGAASSSQCSTAWGSPAVQASQEASRALGFNDKRMQEAEQRAWDYSRQRAQLGWPH